MKHNLAIARSFEAKRRTLRERRAARRLKRLRARQVSGEVPKIDIEEAVVKALGRIVAEHGLSALEFAGGNGRIQVKGPAMRVPVPAAQPATSPMVGTIVQAPHRGLKVGDAVKKGQAVIVVEMLGVFHLIPAPRDGRLTRVLVEEGQPVEFGDSLFAIE